MPNILNYLEWRGDLPLSLIPLCDVDALLLAMLIYDDMPQAEGSGALLCEIADRSTLRERDGNQYFRQWRDLLFTMAETVRFSTVRLHDYVSIVDDESGMQFCAAAVYLPDDTTVVCFRGTDGSVVGWREDFRMAYETVPAQREAAAYLERIAQETEGPIVLTGHSKGGNLAAYAAVYACAETAARIQAVYSLDGPGLDDRTMESASYAAMRPRIHSIIPQSSVVGLLMNYHTGYTVVKADAVGIFQHDGFTWQVKGAEFQTLDRVNNGSRFMDETMHEWLCACTPEKRRQFVEALFSVLDAANVRNFNELRLSFLPTVTAMLREASNLDEESKSMIMKMIGQFISIGAENALQYAAGALHIPQHTQPAQTT